MHLKISAVVLFSVLPPLLFAQPAVVRRYVEWVGGKKKWDAVTTIKASGEYDYGGIKFPFNSVSKAPNRYKFVVPFQGKYYAQGFDGTNGWKIDAFKNETKPTLLTGPEATEMANEADVALEDAFIRPVAGNVIREESDTVIEKRKCAKVVLNVSGALPSFYYLDRETGELVLRKAHAKNKELGGAMLTTHFSDYHTLDGIKIPFRTVHESNGQMILTITVSHATLNEPVNDTEFKP